MKRFFHRAICACPAVLLACLLALPAGSAGAQGLSEVWVCPAGDCGHPGAGYNTIQAGLNAVAAGGTVNVAAGTYVETCTVSKAVTLLGAQADVDVSGRTAGGVAESTLQGGITVSASDVTINGFTLTRPGGQSVVYVGSHTPSYSNVNVTYNLIDNVGGSSYTSRVYSIYLVRGPDSVTISHNRFNNLKSASQSVNGIFVGDSASTDASDGLVIADNTFLDIRSVDAVNHRGAYAILINNGAGTPNALIEDNLIDGLEGLWAHAIGLEGPTPNAIVRGNTIRNVTDYKTPPDGIGVHFEDNASGGTVTVANNSFDNVPVGIAVHPDDLPGGVNGYSYAVSAENNHWGSDQGPSGIGPGDGSAVGANVDYYPWTGTLSTPTTVYVDDGWAGMPDGTTVIAGGDYRTIGYDAFDGIQEGIGTVASGGTVNVAAGLYTERILIDKPLTLLGATHAVNKNGYSVPPGYAWDTAVESVIDYPDPTGLAQSLAQLVDITSSDVTVKGFVVQVLNARCNYNGDNLFRINAGIAGGPGTYLDNILVENNVLGPATNTVLQDGTCGRMGLYLASPTYPAQRQGITNSRIAGNTIFGAEGNGNNVFIWGAAEAYASIQNADYSGTVIEDNDIYGSHRSGIEIAGGVTGLTIRDNAIHDNRSTNGGPLSADLKYGNGIVIIRMGADKASATALGVVDLTLSGNAIYDNEKNGVYLGPIAQNVSIDENEITGNGWDGLRIDLTELYHGGTWPVYDGLSDVSASENVFTGNSGYGVQVVGTPTNGFTLDGEYNWWGCAEGAGNPGCDTVAGAADHSPRLGAVPGTSPMTFYVDPGDNAQDVNDLIAGFAASGDTIVLQPGVHTATGGYEIAQPGMTVQLAAGAILQPSSPCFTVSADDTTLSGGVCEPSDGSHGILTGLAVDNLVIQGIEIRKGATATGDGIHIGHDVNNLQVVDCFVHGLDGDGLEYAAGVTVSGVHEVQGNLFQGNTGYGINNASAAAYDVTYNAWGDVAGPAGANGDGANGTLTFDPWTHAAVSMLSSGSPVADRVAVGARITYTVRMDAAQVYGADFDLAFDNTRLQVVAITNAGTFVPAGLCRLSTPAEANASGAIAFCGQRFTALDGSAQPLYDVVFEGLAAGSVPLDLDEADDQFAMAPPYGSSTNVYAAALTDGNVTVFGAFSVSGRIDLQGRADDTGAALSFGTGSGQGYGPFAFTLSNYWGNISASGVVEDSYTITVTMPRYLDVTLASGKSVAISAAKTALNSLVLFAGDVGGGPGGSEDNVIDVSDAAIVGGLYGGPGTGDLNNDGSVNLPDLVLVGSNLGKTADSAYAGWTP